MLRMPAFGARRAVARPQRVRADHRAGVGHRVAHRHARDRAARAVDGRPDRRHPRCVRGAGRHSRSGARIGRGQLVEMPMAEVALNVAAEPIVTWSAYGTLLERQGNRGPNGAPQGVYACARRRAVGGGVDPHRRPLAIAVRGARRSRVGARARPRDAAPVGAPDTTTSTAGSPSGSPNAIATRSSPS